MKKLFRALPALLLPAIVPFTLGAQTATQCGMDLLHNELRKSNPEFSAELAWNADDIRIRTARNNTANMKTTASNFKVQVVFHIVLDSAQVRQLGGPAGIQARVSSQMQQLNADWNARNADSNKTPNAFRALRGNMGVEFVLARRDPAGKATPGYEIVYTTRSSYNIQGNIAGSSIAYSDAKYAGSGGAAAWDPQRYYNVWVLNMLPAGVLGIATPPRRPPYDLFPEAEQGTCIFYGAFGRKSGPSEYYTYPQATMGRTLTHETGHFLNLFHTWGSDSTCNDDDGIGDTPLQGTNTANNSPLFPVLDGCTKTGSGVMFMNFMDYAIDTAQSLFTKGQVAATHADLKAGGLRNGLVIAATTSIAEGVPADRIISVFPNPAGDACRVRFSHESTGTVQIFDMMGRELSRTVVKAESELSLSLAGLPAGNYLLRFADDAGVNAAAVRLSKR